MQLDKDCFESKDIKFMVTKLYFIKIEEFILNDLLLFEVSRILYIF